MIKMLRTSAAVLIALALLCSSVPLATAQASDSLTLESSGVTIDLGSSGEAIFRDTAVNPIETDSYTLESVTVYIGLTVAIIDVMDGNPDATEYMQAAELDISATYDHMDWLGGEWTDDHAWDVYSGAYKLNYREYVYLDYSYNAELDLYIGIGMYGSEDDLAADIEWIQDNLTIDNEALLAEADSTLVDSVLAGTAGFEPEPAAATVFTVADWEADGLVSETEYQSPFSDTSFTWDGEIWVFPFTQNDAILADDGMTRLELRTSDLRGEVKLTTVEAEATPADLVAEYSSDEYIQYQLDSGNNVEIVDSYVGDETGSVIYLHHTAFGHPVINIMDFYVQPSGVVIVSEISAAPEDIADVYASFWDSVQSNGEYYPLTWTIEDIEAL